MKVHFSSEGFTSAFVGGMTGIALINLFSGDKKYFFLILISLIFSMILGFLRGILENKYT